jgi:hypothetical protein
MPHVSGHNPTSGSNISSSLRPKIRPKRRDINSVVREGERASPVMGSRDPQGRIGVAGPKGGGEAAKAQVEVGSPAFRQYNTDGKYGYYNDQGFYVPADIDMRDGGGMDANDTFFEGGGLMSLLGNIAKIKPYGQKDTPREQIGFRNVADMFDRGGPQHSGGEYRGGGKISMLGNMMDEIGGVNQGARTRYNYDTTPTATRATGDLINNIEPREPIPVYDLDGNPQNNAALNTVANNAIASGVEPLYPPSQTFNMTSRAEAIAALRRKAKNPESWDRFMKDDPAEAEELIQDAMRKQNPLFPANP